MTMLGFNPDLWTTMVGIDGCIHRLPKREEHEPYMGCVCDPVQYIAFSGGHMFIHRVLSC